MIRKILLVLLLCSTPCLARVKLEVGDRIHSNLHGGQDGTVAEVGTDLWHGFVRIHWDYMARGEESPWLQITPYEILEQEDREIKIDPDKLP